MPSIGQSHKEFQILPACGRWRHHQTKLAWEMCRDPKCEALYNFVNLLSQDWTLYGILQVFCSTVFAWDFLKHIFRVSSRAQDQSSNWFFCYVCYVSMLRLWQATRFQKQTTWAFRIETWKLWKTLVRNVRKQEHQQQNQWSITFYKHLHDISRIWILHAVAQTLFAGASLEQLAPSKQNSVTRHVVNTSEAGALESILTVLNTSLSLSQVKPCFSSSPRPKPNLICQSMF